MFLVFCGVGLLLVSYFLGVWRWAELARSIPKHRLHDGSEPAFAPEYLDTQEDESPEVLHDEMVAAGRRLMAALERERALNVGAPPALDESSALTLRQARELVDSAADDYLRATQGFRASAQSSDHERKKPPSPSSFGAATSPSGPGLVAQW